MPTIREIAGHYRLFFFSFDCGDPKHVLFNVSARYANTGDVG